MKKGTSKSLPTRRSMAGPVSLSASAVVPTAKRNEKSDKGTIKSGGVHDYKSVSGHIRINQISEIGKEILCCKYSEEYNYIGVGCSAGELIVVDVKTGKPEFTLIDSDVQITMAPLTDIQHRPISKNYPISNSFTCTYANGYVKCWNYEYKQCLYSIKENREVFGVCYHPRYPKFVTYGDDSKIFLYDEESKTQERVLSNSNNPKLVDGHTSRVFAAAFNPRSNYELLTGGWDDIVCFWDLRQPHAIRHLSKIHMCGEGLDINQKGTEILTCSFQDPDSFQVWDYGSGKLIGTIDESVEASKLYCGKFLHKDYAVYGGTSPNVFRIIDLSNYLSFGSILGLPSAVYSLDLGAPKVNDEFSPGTSYEELPSVAFVSGQKLFQVDFC